jgi:hypothetical protein
VKTGPMHLKIFISRLRIVVYVSVFRRECVIVTIFWGKVKVFLFYVFIPQYAFIMILWFFVIYEYVMQLFILSNQLIKRSTVMFCVRCWLSWRNEGCFFVGFLLPTLSMCDYLAVIARLVVGLGGTLDRSSCVDTCVDCVLDSSTGSAALK